MIGHLVRRALEEQRSAELFELDNFMDEQIERLRAELNPGNESELNTAQLKRQAEITRRGHDVGGAGIPWSKR